MAISKATKLSHPSYRYIHALLSRIVIDHGDNIRVLSHLDLLYLHSMMQSEPIYLKYVIADYMCH